MKERRTPLPLLLQHTTEVSQLKSPLISLQDWLPLAVMVQQKGLPEVQTFCCPEVVVSMRAFWMFWRYVREGNRGRARGVR